MKRIYLLTVIIFVTNFANSQELSFGARLGMTRSSMVQNFADFSNTNGITGFTGGFYGKAKFLGFFVMPEIIYNERGVDIQNVGTNTTHYVDVPLLVGKEFLKIIRINGGPVLQYAVANSQISNPNYINNSSINNFVVGMQAGVGVDLWKFSFDIRYDTNISNSGSVDFVAKHSSSLQNYSYSSRASMWQFIIGYRFLKI